MLVEFVTDIDSPSGYSNFARKFIRAVSEQGIDCRITRSKHDRTTIPLDEWWARNIVEFVNNDGTPDLRMQIETPEFFRKTNTAKNIGFTFWETSRIPSTALPGEPPLPAPQYNWVRQMNMMDEMWTSAEFAAQAFVDSGVTVPTKVIGIPIEEPSEAEGELDIRGVTVDMGDRPIRQSDRPIVIACIAQWTWRKNLEDAIIAVCTEFRANEVVLLLKTYGASQNVEQEEERIRTRTRSIKGTLGLRNMPRIVLLQNTLSDAHMSKLYKSVDIFLSTSRGEGFCIPTAQAMTHGIPTIATGWSAFQDYIIPDETGWLVDYTMEPVYGMPHIPWYRPNQQWAKTNVNDLMAKLREVYKGVKQGSACIIADQGREYIRSNYSREAIGIKAKGMLEDVLSS